MRLSIPFHPAHFPVAHEENLATHHNASFVLATLSWGWEMRVYVVGPVGGGMPWFGYGVGLRKRFARCFVKWLLCP